MGIPESEVYEGERLEPLLTLAQVADTLSISTQTARRLAAEGEIPWIRIGQKRGQIRVRPSDVASYIERRVGA
jgi:excisionase family DNA binding protein